MFTRLVFLIQNQQHVGSTPACRSVTRLHTTIVFFRVNSFGMLESIFAGSDSGRKRCIEKMHRFCLRELNKCVIIARYSEHLIRTKKRISCLEREAVLSTDKAVFVYLHKKMVLNDTPFVNKIRVNQFSLLVSPFKMLLWQSKIMSP